MRFRTALGVLASLFISASSWNSDSSGQETEAAFVSPIDTRSARGPAGAPSAGECTKRFFTGLLDGDENAVEQVTLCRSHIDRLCSRTLVRFGGVSDRFRSKFVKAYGRRAWELLNDPTHLPYQEGASAGANGSITVMRRDVIPDLVRQAENNVEGNHSSVAVPNSEQRLKLVRHDGRWYAMAETLIGEESAESVQQIANLLGKTMVEIQRYSHAIGREGIRPDDIDFDIGLATLKAMNRQGFDDVPTRIDPQSLPEPVPFEPIGDLEDPSAPDELTAQHYRRRASVLLETFLSQDVIESINQLAPELRDLIAPSELLRIRDQIRTQCVGSEPLTPDGLEVRYDPGVGFRVTGALGDDDHQIAVEAFDVDGEWIGLSFRSDRIGLDTRNLSHNLTLTPFVDRHNKLFSLIVAGDAEGAYRMIHPDAEPSGEQYQRFAAGLPNDLAWRGSDTVAVRAAGKDGSRMVRVFSICTVVSGDTEMRTRCLTESVFQDGRWHLRDYHSGNMEERFLLGDYTLQERFFRSLGEGDGNACRKLFSPDLGNQVHQSVLDAYCEQFRETFGAFEAIESPEFFAEARFDASAPNTYARGLVRFAKGRLRFSTEHSLLRLTSFSVEGEGTDALSDFSDRIKDTSDLDQFSQRFIKVLLSDNPGASAGMMSQELREDVGEIDAFFESVAAFRQANGDLKSIRLSTKEYSEQTGRLTLKYAIECQKNDVQGTIKLRFNAIRGMVDHLSLNLEEPVE